MCVFLFSSIPLSFSKEGDLTEWLSALRLWLVASGPRCNPWAVIGWKIDGRTDVPLRSGGTPVTDPTFVPWRIRERWERAMESLSLACRTAISAAKLPNRHVYPLKRDGSLTCCLSRVNADGRDSDDIRPLRVWLRCQNMTRAQTEIKFRPLQLAYDCPSPCARVSSADVQSRWCDLPRSALTVGSPWQMTPRWVSEPKTSETPSEVESHSQVSLMSLYSFSLLKSVEVYRNYRFIHPRAVLNP